MNYKQEIIKLLKNKYNEKQTKLIIQSIENNNTNYGDLYEYLKDKSINDDVIFYILVDAILPRKILNPFENIEKEINNDKYKVLPNIIVNLKKENK